MLIDDILLDGLIEEAAGCERRRMNRDMRTGAADQSQRMLNALMPDTVLPIHRHRHSSETVVVLRGHLTEVFYDDEGRVTDEFDLSPASGRYALQIPSGRWHTVVVHEPTVIFEAKDGGFEPLVDDDILVVNP